MLSGLSSALRISRVGLPLFVFSILSLSWGISPAVAELPRLPQAYVDTTAVPITGRTLSVGAGGDFQAALNAAQPGDMIVLQAGAVFQGPFTLPNKPGAGWITVRTSTPDSALALPGSRVTPALASLMPKIVSPNSSPAITTADGAHHFRFVGIEFTVAPSVPTIYSIVEFGGDQNTAAKVPHHLIVDRCYVHGQTTGNVFRTILLNSAHTAVIDSYVSEAHVAGFDSQAILGYNGPGPFKIVNNHLEGAGENVMFGGADPSIQNLVPADIEIRRNYFAKPLSWRVGDPSYARTPWTVKNLFELKNARRVLVEGNIFERNWVHAQNGFAILFTPRNQDGTAPWSAVEDVTFRSNIVRHSGSGINIMGQDNQHTSQPLRRILISNNLFDDIDGIRWGGDGRLFQITQGTTDVVVEHNTAFQTGAIIVAEDAPNTGFVYRDNITPHNLYGVFGSGVGFGLPALAQYFPGAVFERNVLVGQPTYSRLYPPRNFFPTTLAAVGFSNLAGGDYRLAAWSPYKALAPDGSDLGVNFDGLAAAFGGSSPTVPLQPPTSLTVR